MDVSDEADDISWISTSDRLPTPGELVAYKTARYRFAGYLHIDGKWRDMKGRIEPTPVLAWSPIKPPSSRLPEVS
jgi:hypothetical protein